MWCNFCKELSIICLFIGIWFGLWYVGGGLDDESDSYVFGIGYN